jgi:ferric-dicitrate binding protein FerR (iron transport regulator)
MADKPRQIPAPKSMAMDETIEQHFGTYEQAYEAWRAAHQAACEAEEMVVRCFDGEPQSPSLSAGDIEKARRLRSRAIQMHTAAMALAPDPR